MWRWCNRGVEGEDKGVEGMRLILKRGSTIGEREIAVVITNQGKEGT